MSRLAALLSLVGLGLVGLVVYLALALRGARRMLASAERTTQVEQDYRREIDAIDTDIRLGEQEAAKKRAEVEETYREERAALDRAATRTATEAAAAWNRAMGR